MFFDSLQHIVSSFAESGTTPRIDLSPLWEVLKILIPAVTVWLAARATSRKDQRESELRQQDKLNTSWSDMTAQSREIIAGLQRELAEMRNRLIKTEKRADQAERRAEHAEQEAERSRQHTNSLQKEHDELQEELKELSLSFQELKKDYSKALKELEGKRA